jgi:hypothetical protein
LVGEDSTFWLSPDEIPGQAKDFSWPGFGVAFRPNAHEVSPVTCSVHFSRC